MSAPLPSGGSPPAVALDAVSVTFGRQTVLRALTLSVPAGQTLCVIGESGCGKTVLLKLVVGLQRPTRGAVRLDGRDISRLSESQLIHERLRVGYLFQGAALFDSLTVEENVAFGLQAQRKFGDDEIAERVRARIKDVGLPETVLAKKPAELSGGMKKRVGLARALALDPDVMLYDEPTTGLDPIMSDVINELILRARRRRPVTGVVVTHDMKTVFKVADRVVMLFPLAQLKADQSQVLFDGTPDELRKCPDPRVRQFVEGEAGDRLE